MKRNTLRATLMLIGTTIGAGIFGIPAMMGTVGIWAGSFLFWFVALVVLATQILYLELILRDPERRRLPGYIGHAFGPWGKHLAAVTHTFQLVGINFAYLLLGGEFLWILSRVFGFSWELSGWRMVFWVVGLLALLGGLKMAARIESNLTWMLIGLICVMIVLSVPHVHLARVFESHWMVIDGAIGVFLFSLFGCTAIPEMHEVTGRTFSQTRTAVIRGTLSAAFLIWLFGVVTFAALPGVAADRVALTQLLPNGLLWVLPLMGFTSVMASFVAATYDLFATYRTDFHWPVRSSWMLALGLPLILVFIISNPNLLEVLATVGAIFTATNGLLIVLAAKHVMRHDTKTIPRWWRTTVPVIVSAIFLFMILQRLFTLLVV